jgi:MFS family permease
MARAGRERRWTPSVVAFLVSVLGASMAATALTTVLGKQVFDLTGSELDLGLLGLAEFAPAALLVLVSGTLADRVDRRMLSAVGLLGQAGAAAALGWYASSHPTSATPIFLLVIVFGTARAFATPATRALPPDIVAEPAVPWLMVRRSAAWQLAAIAGPVIGGFLYVVHITLPFVFAVGALVVSAVAVMMAHTLDSSGRPAEDAPVTGRSAADLPVDRVDHVDHITEDALLEAGVEPAEVGVMVAPPPRATLHDAMEGLRFIRRQPVLLGAISLDLFAVLFGGAVALLPAIAEDRLGVGAVGLGWLRASVGIGAALVTLYLAWRPVQRHIGITLLVVVALFGVFTVVLGVTTSFAVAFVALLAASGADAISVFIRATLVPLVTPNETRGRVLAVENVFIGASNELGAFESGVAGQLLGTAGAVALGGVATIAVAGLWWTWFPALRRVDRFPGA